MEHGIILLIEAILALDRRLQKPLNQVIPELSRQRGEPRAYLAEEAVVIGPRRPFAVAGVLGMAVGIGVLVVFVIAALERPRNQAAGGGMVLLAGLTALISAVAVTMLLLHWLRGGSAVLRAEGVEFVYRGRSLFCPWTLFQVVGAPYQPDHKRVILPVNDQVVLAQRDGDDTIVARPAAEVKARSLAACAEGQMALADLYEVKLMELGQLLLDLGARLGDGEISPGNSGETSPAPLATAEADGWMRIRLTRLPFPPICAGCGNSTRESIALPLDARNTARIDLPFCRACQMTRARRRARSVFWGLVLGIAPAVVWIIAGGAVLRLGDVLMGLVIFLPIGMIFGLIVGFVLRDRTDPVRFRDYSSATGTVAMLLKPETGSAEFVRELGVTWHQATADAPTDG